MAEKSKPEDESVDQKIQRLLAGTDEEIRLGVARIFECYSGPICARVRRTFRWLPHEDLADAWQTTVIMVWQRAVARKLDTKRPIFGFLCVVMSRRCSDILTRAYRHKASFQAFAEAVANNKAPDETLRIEWAEAFHVIDKAIPRLPCVQRAIWLAYREKGYCATDEELLDVLLHTPKRGKPWTIDSVRRGKQEGRDKLRRILERRGYL